LSQGRFVFCLILRFETACLPCCIIQPMSPDSDERRRPEEFEHRDPVTIRRFRDLPEALLAKGSLESAGIRCALADDNMVRLDWFISNLIGGVKLQVCPEDAAAASEILDQPIPEEFETEGTGEYRQPRCPNCQSLDVSFEELNKPIAYASASIGFPLPIHRTAWKCHACGREWDDDETLP
jgi:DNA-directed RNA polymerase subunit RPC12/RpoP